MTSKAEYKCPSLAVDLVILYRAPEILDSKIVVIERRNPPLGLALPGGFVDYGEAVETAALREAKEETNLDIDGEKMRLIGVYSDPARDPRQHVVSVAFLGSPKDPNQLPVAGDDAKDFKMVSLRDLDSVVWCFDHRKIVDEAIRKIELETAIETLASFVESQGFAPGV